MSHERLRVMALFGTRPELIKLYPVLERLKQGPFNVVSVSTSQHREMIEKSKVLVAQLQRLSM